MMGGALGPSMFTHVKYNNCKTEYNSKTAKSNQTNILIYFLAGLVIAFCACGGFAFRAIFLNNQ